MKIYNPVGAPNLTTLAALAAPEDPAEKDLSKFLQEEERGGANPVELAYARAAQQVLQIGVGLPDAKKVAAFIASTGPATTTLTSTLDAYAPTSRLGKLAPDRVQAFFANPTIPFHAKLTLLHNCFSADRDKFEQWAFQLIQRSTQRLNANQRLELLYGQFLGIDTFCFMVDSYLASQTPQAAAQVAAEAAYDSMHLQTMLYRCIEIGGEQGERGIRALIALEGALPPEARIPRNNGTHPGSSSWTEALDFAQTLTDRRIAKLIEGHLQEAGPA